MDQITALSRKKTALRMLALTFLFSASMAVFSLKESEPDAASGPEETDEILEELKFSNQGIFTDSEQNTQKDSPPSKTDIDESSDKTKGQKEHLSEKITPTSLNETSSRLEDENPEESPLPLVESEESFIGDADSIEQELTEYFASPSRIKKEALERKLNRMILKNPKDKEAYQRLFELYHHYMEWSQDTEFYQENHPFQTLKLLQDMHKRFGQDSEVMKYLCQYFIINHLYVESKSYCKKAKALLPNDTDLRLYADYFNESSEDSLKSQRLLNLLKTKPPSEKLYTAIGKMFMGKKKYKLSAQYFQKAVKMNDFYIPGLLGFSEVLLKSGRHETALKYYVSACQKHPYKSREPFQKAKAYLNRKSLFEMAARYQKQINICINSIKILQ